MKAFSISGWDDWTVPWAAALGLVALTAMFALELRDFRSTVIGWAERDLRSRTELAAHHLEEPLRTSDFRRLHAFGDECIQEGVRLTVFSAQGGVFFDTQRTAADGREMLFAEFPSGEYRVRLGLSHERVLAPVVRARRGLALAGVLGGFAVLIVFFFTFRQRLRMRELARSEKFQRNFIADVSHEIKTPLTGILGAVQLMKDAPPELLPKLLDMVEAETRRLNRLVQSILDLARLERPQSTLQLESVDLVPLAEAVCKSLTPLAESHRMTIRLKAQGPLMATVDSRLVTQALDNLIINAIRHSGASEVTVSLARVRQRLEIAVEDHGIGIPAAHRAHVFERFHRVDESRSAAGGGAGLGLAIVREIALSHYGEARLEPLAPSGCRFVISLPSATGFARHEQN